MKISQMEGMGLNGFILKELDRNDYVKEKKIIGVVQDLSTK